MLILQFAFDGRGDNPYLPHNHIEDGVVYTGTHDNDTSLGWFQSLPEWMQQQVMDYLGSPQEVMPWPLIRAAYASPARQAIIPLQDILALGGEHRMNTPGVPQGNWRWRFKWEDITPQRVARLRTLTEKHSRIAPAVG